MTTDDMGLVGEYARRHSEEAFAMLVSRHVNLVYSVALHQLRDASLAEEVAQATFIILARKAGSLSSKTVLSAWLCRTAQYVAANAVRTEYRRQCREQETYMQSVMNQPESESSPWPEIAPLLNIAMAELGDKYHSAIVLRFFEGKDFKQIGAELGIGERTAQTRVRRAVEKLRKFFLSRGVVTSTTVLTAMIAANSVQAAPAMLANTVTAVALGKAATASGSTLTLIKGALKLMAWTKTKVAIVSGVAILLAAGTTTVTITVIAHHREDTIWGHITGVDGRQLNAVPPAISVRPAKSGHGGGVWDGNGKRMAFRASVAALLSSAYDISEDRIVDSAAMATNKYDYIVSLPDHQSEALQNEIKKKLGLVAKKEMRETEVFLLKVASQNAPGLKLGREPDPGGATSSADSGVYTSENGRISSLRVYLESRLKTPVIDQTGLADKYDIDLKWGNTGGNISPDLDALKQAVLDQLGLELAPSRESIEMLVVEKVK